jgi:Patatin-like phospholipase
MTTENSDAAAVSKLGSDDTATPELIKCEKAIIAAHRQRNSTGEWTGIGLSGGGIRSATFCLGALQALALKNVLKDFDYISSVSGGGYTSAALQWHWSNGKSYGTSKENFPYGADFQSNNKLLAFLRGHARYLTPGGGLTFWSLPAVVFRTIFLNIFIWIPLSAAAFIGLFCVGKVAAELLPFLAQGSFHQLLQENLLTGSSHIAFNILAQLILGVIVVFAYFTLLLLIFSSIIPPESTDTRGTTASRVLKTLVLAIVFAALAVYGFVTGYLFPPNSGGALSKFIAWLPLPLVSGLLLIIGFQIFGNLAFNEQYRARRLSEIYGGKALAAVIALSLMAAVPDVYQGVTRLAGGATGAKGIIGALSALSSIVTGVYGHLTRAADSQQSSLTKYLASIGAGLFLYSIAILAYLLADSVMPADEISAIFKAFYEDKVQALAVVWIILAVYFAFSTNINYLGLYRFYRDRLMEAFMPSPASLKSWSTGYSEADLYSIADLWPQDKPPRAPQDKTVENKKLERPYPIFNTNAIMVNDPDPKLFERGGDNFIFSPLYIGSTSTGWQRTPAYIAAHGPVTLPTAMAASGAALNSYAAYIGEGITREKLVSVAMMLMNLRLGWWFAKPNSGARQPNHIFPGFSAGVLGCGHTSESKFLELSDGGNFDNLGLYELVRRRLKIILILDGEEDEASAMPALVSVVQRVRDDFNVVIDLDKRVDDLMPLPASGFPAGVAFSKSAYFTAKINYPGTEAAGILVYVKARMIPDLGFIVRGFRAKNSNFPNEPTLNQFFEPEQFEAYRALGFVSMTSALGALSLDGCLPASASLLKKCGL